MARRGITYDQLVAKLAEIGVKEEPKNVRNKVARGGFSAVFLVQCLKPWAASPFVSDQDIQERAGNINR
jgi:hypothetical protein